MSEFYVAAWIGNRMVVDVVRSAEAAAATALLRHEQGATRVTFGDGFRPRDEIAHYVRTGDARAMMRG